MAKFVSFATPQGAAVILNSEQVVSIEQSQSDMKVSIVTTTAGGAERHTFYVQGDALTVWKSLIS